MNYIYTYKKIVDSFQNNIINNNNSMNMMNNNMNINKYK